MARYRMRSRSVPPAFQVLGEAELHPGAIVYDGHFNILYSILYKVVRPTVTLSICFYVSDSLARSPE